MRTIKDLLTAVGILTLVLIPLTLLGLIVILPLLAWANAKGLTKLPLLNGIYGNTFDGLDGSGKFQAKYAHLPRILRQYLWLAIRNPTENLKRLRLGLHWQANTVVLTYRVKLDEDGSAVFPGDIEKVSGSVFTEVVAVSISGIIKRYFEYYLISKPYTLFGKTRCLRIRIGWKIGNIDKRVPGEIKAFEFAVNPFQVWGGDLTT